MINLSAVILTKNEGKNIGDCVKSVSFCDEIVVIDDASDDQTIKIIQKSKIKNQNYNSKVKIFQRSLNGDFATQRNFGIEQASGRWILFVDTDERVGADLANEILALVNGSQTNIKGAYVKREDFFFGKKLRFGETGNIKLLRLARKGAGRWRRRVHEVWEITGDTITFKNSLLHYPHQTLREFLAEINWLSSLHAKANKEEGKTSNILKIIFWPKFKFLQNWILRGGFLDGGRGFIIALLMSFHSFLAWSKLWILQKETR